MNSPSNPTDLFSGNACFSPRVPPAVQKEWVQHGGNVANLRSDKTCATYVFCDGEDDPWFARLFERSMAIFHWGWVSAVVAAQFPVPISAYVLDGYSSAPVQQPARTSEAEGDAYEDADRTLLSTSPRAAQPRIPSPSASCRSKSESVDPAARACPEIDLRAVSRSRQASRSARSRRERAPPLQGRDELDALSHDERTLVHRHEDRDRDRDRATGAFVRLLLLSGTSGAISVSDALEALQHVSTGKAAQFMPGTTHLGEEFRCWYA